MNFQLLLFVIGLSLLYFGAEWLVKGASLFAKKVGISSTLTGITVVAFGTSAPELVVSVASVYREKEMIAIGNVVGSNICNFTMVLGISALIRPIASREINLVKEICIVVVTSLCFFILSLDSKISILDGLILFVGSIVYIKLNYNKSKKRNNQNYSNISLELNLVEGHKILITILFGILLMTVGCEFLLGSSIKIMNILGVSEKCVGLTVVAAGTSIPELVTSIVATMRKQVGISVGNLIGSNIFNMLNVVGVTALISPILIKEGFFESKLVLDYLVMIFVSTLPLFIMRGNKVVSRVKGLLLILLYIFYVTTLFTRP